MTKLLLPIILFVSILLSGEMEVDGDLKVTGTVESTTIDSLKQVIAELQAQLAALQLKRMELFTSNTDWVVPNDIHSISVEIWGRGGNGGSGNSYAKGGGGGAGYGRGIIEVTPNETLTFEFTDATKIIRGGTTLVYATNGENGDGYYGGSGGTASFNEGIIMNGENGSNSQNGSHGYGAAGGGSAICVFANFGNGGKGGNGNYDWQPSYGEAGGIGAIYIQY